jgi:hypothetical protein
MFMALSARVGHDNSAENREALFSRVSGHYDPSN